MRVRDEGRRPGPPIGRPQTGFSLVELTVALCLMALLMAGMARVFRASLSGNVQGTERLAMSRRGRLALEQLREDVMAAGLLLQSPERPAPGLGPQAPYLSTDAATPEPGLPPSDVLTLTLDQPAEAEGELVEAVGPGHAAAVLAGLPLEPQPPIQLRFATEREAAQVRPGQRLCFLRGLDELRVVEATHRGTRATVVATGLQGEAGGPRHPQPRGGRVLVVDPLQVIRYRIESLGVALGGPRPCLVREVFDAEALEASPELARPHTRTVVVEEVLALKVYLSRDGGLTWSGFGAGGGPFATVHGPDLGAGLDQPGWLRGRAVLVRLDLKVRAPVVRERVGGGVGHDQQVQTLVVAPRHAGLAWQEGTW